MPEANGYFCRLTAIYLQKQQMQKGNKVSISTGIFLHFRHIVISGSTFSPIILRSVFTFNYNDKCAHVLIKVEYTSFVCFIFGNTAVPGLIN